METTLSLAQGDFTGLCFVNLVDFDAVYGHRRDPQGYRGALEEFDRDLEALLPAHKNDDLLIITADHGNDPTFRGTDHTREYVPFLVYNRLLNGGILPESETFADIAATIAENFNVPQTKYGQSRLRILR
jgi:phosphopentomutase